MGAARYPLERHLDNAVPKHCLNNATAALFPALTEARATTPHICPQARFQHTCPHSSCQAQFFPEETSKQTRGPPLFTLCCMRGKFSNLQRVPADVTVFPRAVTDRFGVLLGTRHFQENLRRYNAALAFASFYDNGGNATRSLPGVGPYTYAVHGQVYHSLATLNPPDGRARAFGQLYFFDPHEATQQRAALFHDLDVNVLAELQAILLYDVRVTTTRLSLVPGIQRSTSHLLGRSTRTFAPTDTCSTCSVTLRGPSQIYVFTSPREQLPIRDATITRPHPPRLPLFILGTDPLTTASWYIHYRATMGPTPTEPTI